MKRNILIAPSILSADFSRLDKEIKKAEDSGADMIHIDVMDGHFVPNITVGPFIVEAVRRISDLPLDVHLMIERPHIFLKEFIDAGSDIVTIHAEAYPLAKSKGQRAKSEKGTSRSTERIDEARVKEVLAEIKGFGKKAGISLNPGTPFCIKNVLAEVNMVLVMSVHPGFGGQGFIKEVLPKIEEARRFYSGDIEVDGGINDTNARLVIESGANIIVAGSYFFRAQDPKRAVEKLRAGYKRKRPAFQKGF